MSMLRLAVEATPVSLLVLCASAHSVPPAVDSHRRSEAGDGRSGARYATAPTAPGVADMLRALGNKPEPEAS